MYALVNDIESYPRFLRWCRGACVHSRDETRLTASITIAVSKFHLSLSSENVMTPGRRIEVRLLQGPFRRLSGFWEFEPAGEQRCKVLLEMNFEFKNKALQFALGRPFNHIVNSFVEVFTRRAERIYGKR